MPASFTIDANPQFAAGSTLQVYLRRHFTEGGGPFAAAVTSATVSATQTATFTGLQYATNYWAAQFQSGTWVKKAFRTDDSPTTNDGIVQVISEAPINVQYDQYGAVGDGTTDDTAAIDAALTAAATATTDGEVFIPAGVYKRTSAMTVPDGVRVSGQGKRITKLLHAFNGTFGSLGHGSDLSDLWVAGDGATYTGKGFTIAGTDGGQLVRHCRIIDFADYCIDFTTIGSGSQSTWLDLELWQTLGNQAGKYAVHIVSTQNLSGTPRKFIGIETSGMKFIDFGGCNTVFIADSYVGELAFTADSRGVIVSGSRVGVNEATMTVNGHGVTFAGCKINPAITIAASADQISIDSSNVIEGGAITDSSGNERNQLYVPRTTYTPTWTTGGTAPVLGNGALSGAWGRHGDIIKFEVEFTAGTTTTFGTAEFRFALPLAPSVNASNQVVPVMLYDGSANTYYTGVAIISPATGYATLRADAVAGAITNATPFAWGSTDQLRIAGTYQL